MSPLHQILVDPLDLDDQGADLVEVALDKTVKVELACIAGHDLATATRKQHGDERVYARNVAVPAVLECDFRAMHETLFACRKRLELHSFLSRFGVERGIRNLLTFNEVS